MRIQKKAILQYYLLYLLFLSQGAAMQLNSQSLWDLLMFASAAIILLRHFRQISSTLIITIGVMLVGVFFTRFTNGGIGIEVIIRYIGRIISAYAVFFIDKNRCLSRFVKMVKFFAYLSLAHFILFNESKGLIPIVLNMRGYTQGGVTFDYSLFYAYNNAGVNDEFIRNTSVFTEPALYAMVLVFTLYICLYKSNLLFCTTKERNYSISLLLITLITTFSTTGFVAALVLFIIYWFNKSDHSMRKRITKILCLCIIVAGIEIIINGNDSLILNLFVYKLFTGSLDSGLTFDLNAGTGRYRVSAITTSWSAFLNNPFGLGYEKLQNLIIGSSLFGEASAGGGLVRELAVFGAITSFGFFVYLLLGVKKSISNKFELIAFILIYIICTMSSSTMFYAIPILVASAGYFDFVRKDEYDDIQKN